MAGDVTIVQTHHYEGKMKIKRVDLEARCEGRRQRVLLTSKDAPQG